MSNKRSPYAGRQADDFISRQPGIGFVGLICRLGFAGVQIDARQVRVRL
jgi:hypothetical protein